MRSRSVGPKAFGARSASPRRRITLLAAMLLGACHGGGATRTVAPLALTGTAWELVTVQGQDASRQLGGHPAILRLATDRSVAGFTGCNRFHGTYTLAGDSIRFGPLIIRHRACAGSPELEQSYLDALRATRQFRFHADSLNFMDSTATVAVFVRY